jgi:hypothetical protein
MTEGMMMVMKDGHVTVVPKEGEKQAFYAGGSGGIGTEAPSEPTGCLGCH